MTIYAGTLCFKPQLQLHCRLLFMPWVRKKSGIVCLKIRDYSSSNPARYIPKKASKVNIRESYPGIKGSDKKEFHELSGGFVMKSEIKHCRSGVQSYRDFDEKPLRQSQISCSDSLSNEVEQASPELEEEMDKLSGDVRDGELLEEPEEISEELDVLQGTKATYDVEKAAIELLAGRAFTAVELRKKLCRKGFSVNTIEAVIQDFMKRDCYTQVFGKEITLNPDNLIKNAKTQSNPASFQAVGLLCNKRSSMTSYKKRKASQFGIS